MKNEGLSERVTITMTPGELERLDGWAFGQRIRSRSEAVRRLVNLGLAADAAGWSPEAAPEPGSKSKVRGKK